MPPNKFSREMEVNNGKSTNTQFPRVWHERQMMLLFFTEHFLFKMR